MNHYGPRHHRNGDPMPKDDVGHLIDAGIVSKSARWFSLAWWRGHHLDRDEECGQWEGDPWAVGVPRSERRVCTKAAKHKGGHGQWRAPRRREVRAQRAQDYRAYLESEYDKAEEATRGVLLNARGQKRGLHPRTLWFSGRRGSLAHASEEYREHVRTHGRPLTRGEFDYQAYEDGPAGPYSGLI